jgi:hypothetical protein
VVPSYRRKMTGKGAEQISSLGVRAGEQEIAPSLRQRSSRKGDQPRWSRRQTGTGNWRVTTAQVTYVSTYVVPRLPVQNVNKNLQCSYV